MHRRAFERITVKIPVKFYFGDNNYSGTVKNLSKNGMFIDSNNLCSPFDSEFNVIFPVHDEVLNIPVRICRITKTEGCYDGIGVALLNPSQKYLEFVGGLRSA